MSKQTTAEMITWIEGQIRAKNIWLRDHASKFPESMVDDKRQFSDYQSRYVRYQEKEAV